MPRPLLKCPACGKRGVRYTAGPFRGSIPSYRRDMTMEEAVKVADAREKARQEGTTWDLSCRYCGLKKNITHPELVTLWKSDPVFMRKYMGEFNKPEFQERLNAAVMEGVKHLVRSKKR